MLSHINKYLFAVLVLPGFLQAQQPIDRSTYFDVPNLSKQVGSLSVIPFFINGSDKFWFAASDTGRSCYYFVNPAARTRQLISDPAILAGKLAVLRNEHIDTTGVSADGPPQDKSSVLPVRYKNSKYAYNFETGELRLVEQERRKEADHRFGLSSDKQWQLFAKDHNLYLRRLDDSTVIQLSTDGALYYSFNINDDDTSAVKESSTNAVWIKDSDRFYILRKDRRRVGTMSVLHTLFNPRPRVETYKYELPGDQEVTAYELFIGDTTSKKLTRLDIGRWKDQEVEVVCAGSKIWFLRKKRTRDEMELCAVNPVTADVQPLIHEISHPFINEDLFKVAVLNDGKDILWWSDRTGWGHYYLYDQDGRLKNALTTGNWTVGKMLKIDTVSRRIWFYGYGKQKEINPYYAFVYSVHLSGEDLRLLTPENATHNVFVSPGGYLVDNYSRIDMEPRTVVRDVRGHVIMQAWKPDISRLYRYGWKKPEMFRIKSADGITDIYGIMWKPFNFDSTLKYPIISQVYPGPQTETVWSDFTVFDRYNNTALAQTGCIVVCMGHRGGSPYRGKAYHSYGYGKLRDYALEDDKAGLEQLSARYSFIDTLRVGIFGHSGGGMMAVAALCTYPHFYKVAVASSGNHDNKLYNRTWGETFQGVQQVGDSLFTFDVRVNQELASRLQGHLLLVTGEVDANVHPGNTYRMANALINAGKNFDMLVLPGQSHKYEGVYKEYFEFRLREYFKSYLIGRKPTE